MKNLLKDYNTIVYRTCENKHSPSLRGYVIFTETLVNTPVIDHHIIMPLINAELKNIRQKPYLIDTVAEQILETNEEKKSCQ